MNKVQTDAVNALLENDGQGIIISATGTGKTFMYFKFLYKLVEHKDLSYDDEIWILAETDVRWHSVEEEAAAFDKAYGLNPLIDFKNIKMHCYQGLPKGNPKVMIADEIHESLTPVYKQVYDNEYTFFAGFTATLPEHLKVYRDNEESTLTKGELARQITDIVFEYSLENAIEDGILAPFQTTVIDHNLESKLKTVKVETKTKSFYTTEASFHNFHKKNLYNATTPWQRNKAGGAMSRFLWNLQSKVEPAKALIEKLEGKTIIFAPELSLLHQITDNVVYGDNGKTNNQRIIDAFNNDEIDIIASAKKLKQGITLKGIENAILLSYYKEGWHLIQQLGRVVRKGNPDKIAKLYVFRTIDTFEEKWYTNLSVKRDKKKQIIDQIDLNVQDVIYSKSLLL